MHPFGDEDASDLSALHPKPLGLRGFCEGVKRPAGLTLVISGRQLSTPVTHQLAGRGGRDDLASFGLRKMGLAARSRPITEAIYLCLQR